MTDSPNQVDAVDEILSKLYATNERYVSDGGYDVTEIHGLESAKAKLNALLIDARIDELRGMPHQRDADLQMHDMTDDKIPQLINCRCYKGRRIKELEKQREATDAS